MALCDICGNYKNHVSGRKVNCKVKGFANQRINNCNMYIKKNVAKKDRLAWAEVL